MRLRKKLAFALLTIAVPTSIALAKRAVREVDIGPPTFELQGRPIGGAQPASATAAYLTASRITAAGDGALVIDGDSGALVRTDKAGKTTSSVAISDEAGLMAYDPIGKVAYVADRKNDKLVVVSVGETLQITKTIKTPAEPFAVALTPDRKTVLVSTIADRVLVGYDVAAGTEKWRTPLAREPRGLAVSPDGKRALVAYLATGTVDQVDIAETHRAEHIALSTAAQQRTCRRCGNTGDSFARASFAVTFMGASQAIVPFQRETPVQQSDGSERTSSYGGGFEPPITQQVAFLGFGKDTPAQVIASIAQHQPRAMAWDSAHDALYIVGLGSDSLLQLRNASQVGIAEGITQQLSTAPTKSGSGSGVALDRCGPDGVAVAPDGNVFVWCAFTRTVQRVEVVDTKGQLAANAKATSGPALIASKMTQKAHDGMVIFHAADAAVSQRGSMACSSCHPDNRADGLSWRIDKHALQTPILSGRVVGTGPYKWDGTDKSLRDSMTSTMKRLGGFGLDTKQTDSLMAYVEQLPTVRTPSRDTAQVTRGKALFDSAQLGCRSCHDGKSYTDSENHKLSGTLTESNTPSLLGLAASAPYFHDGSPATLEALLRDRGAVHGMAETSQLSDTQVADLTAFLETL